MTANASENSNRESEVGRLAHYCVRRGVPNLEGGRNIIQKHGAMSMALLLVVLLHLVATLMILLSLTMIASLHFTPSCSQMYSALWGSGFDLDAW